jgi:Ca2+-binding EF-hand superfamily protein
MVSDLAAEKHGQTFDVFDADEDGYLDRGDLDALAARLAEGAGVGDSSVLHEVYLKFWESLAGELGIDTDASMSREAFIEGLDRLAKLTPTGFDEAIAQIPRAVLAIYDRDGDGKVSGEEFLAMQAASGVPKEKAEIALLALDRDADGMLGVDDLVAATREFILSDDLYAPGNWLFGGLAPKPVRYF